MTPEQLAARADVIAIGKVSELRSEWNEGRTSIHTKVVLAVEEYVKGSGDGPTVTVYVPGGEVGGVGEMYTHMPSFKKEEDVIVFAERDNRNRLRVSGGANGKLLIKKDDATGMPVVSGKEPKEVFVSRIKQALKSQKSKP